MIQLALTVLNMLTVGATNIYIMFAVPAMAISSTSGLPQDDGLWIFLRNRGVPEESIQKMQQDHVSHSFKRCLCTVILSIVLLSAFVIGCPGI